MRLGHQGKFFLFFFSFFFDTNVNFLLNRLREPIQPTTPPPRRVNRVNASRRHPQQKKRPKRRFVPPFGPRYARLRVPRHYDGHFDDERGLKIGLEPLQVSFFHFLIVFSYFY